MLNNRIIFLYFRNYFLEHDAMRKRILITGAAGFLGPHLCDKFIKEGYYVSRNG